MCRTVINRSPSPKPLRHPIQSLQKKSHTVKGPIQHNLSQNDSRESKRKQSEPGIQLPTQVMESYHAPGVEAGPPHTPPTNSHSQIFLRTLQTSSHSQIFDTSELSQVFSPSSHTALSTSTQEDFANYTDAVLTGCVRFIHLHGTIHAVEGWSKETGEGTDQWYHFNASVLNYSDNMVCTCPARDFKCIHQQFYAMHGLSKVSDTDTHFVRPGEQVIMFQKESADIAGTFAVHHFSVAKSNEELGLAHRTM
ncbi:hypothetical protein GYMLUDRAFT_62332 [Collybiopsis luxurians FD-317 M1]|uniref:Uncharacterized protein n=1 Tax=Collybiopsis luxurians FD-317 M1 TaxID=944289 RepID=A0A0D0BLR0_9AGAR|nr:hypothetical protein GYMLUDRAFT_62332 [Collybiopsis luxurians FD-317 M1]